MTQEEKIQALAALVLKERKEYVAENYSPWQADELSIHVVHGRKYTRIDRGDNGHDGEGFLMIDPATGEVFGIKGYGVIHRGHPYGTLDTISDWHWGDFYPRPR